MLSMSWLEQLLRSAHREQMCMTPYCTTCGAMPFRRALLQTAARQAGMPEQGYWSLPLATAVARSAMEMPENSVHQHYHALRLIFIVLNDGISHEDFQLGVRALIAGTPAGQVLEAMYLHWEKVQREQQQQDEMNSPAAVQRGREERKRRRSAAHAERLRRKRARDIEMFRHRF